MASRHTVHEFESTCRKCGKELKQNGILHICYDCLQKYNNVHDDKNLCNACGTKLDNPKYKLCSMCRNRLLKQYYLRKKNKKAETCSKCFSRMRLPDHEMCEVCLALGKEYRRKSISKYKAKIMTSIITDNFKSSKTKE